MNPSILNIGDVVAHSGVGPGLITGFSKHGFPEVNGRAVGNLVRTDGAKYGPGGLLQLPAEHMAIPVPVAPLSTADFDTGVSQRRDPQQAIHAASENAVPNSLAVNAQIAAEKVRAKAKARADADRIKAERVEAEKAKVDPAAAEAVAHLDRVTEAIEAVEVQSS